ncbi:MAG: hypothetical protein K6E40_12220 [Desulfovibrio sp.]|nr:hypothetical protein [Desulfovibrio sp.]
MLRCFLVLAFAFLLAALRRLCPLAASAVSVNGGAVPDPAGFELLFAGRTQAS